jgi:hypothetical protein
MAVANTLAYYYTATNTGIKGFIAQAPALRRLFDIALPKEPRQSTGIGILAIIFRNASSLI